jgi:VWFA-related protein
MALALYRHVSLLVGLSAISASVSSSQSIERIVYASVLDRAGRPVTNLDPKDLIVRENNVDRHVLQLSQATEPVDIAVLVDTSQDAEALVPDFRRALLDFLRVTSGRHEIALFTFGQRPRTVVDYTRDQQRLAAGVAHIAAQHGSGAYLMDGLIEASRSLRTRERPQREVLVVTSEGGELSDRNSEDVFGEVQASGVTVYAFVVMAGSQGRFPAFEAGTRERPLPTSTPDQPEIERAVALEAVVRDTGGRREDLVTSGVLGAKLREHAVRLNNQYRIIYEGPPRLTAPASIEIVTTRPDLRAQVTRTPQNLP